MKRLPFLLAFLSIGYTTSANASKILLEEIMVNSKKYVSYASKRYFHSQNRISGYKPERTIVELPQETPNSYFKLPARLNFIDKKGEVYTLPSSSKQSAVSKLKPSTIQEINDHTLFVDLKKKN